MGVPHREESTRYDCSAIFKVDVGSEFWQEDRHVFVRHFRSIRPRQREIAHEEVGAHRIESIMVGVHRVISPPGKQSSLSKVRVPSRSSSQTWCSKGPCSGRCCGTFFSPTFPHSQRALAMMKTLRTRSLDIQAFRQKYGQCGYHR